MLQRGMLLGHYRLKKDIGSSRNDVYLAEDIKLSNVEVALKVSRKDIASFSTEGDINRAVSEFKRKFKHEAEIVRQLRNEHILEIYEYDENTIDGIIYTYLAMPYIKEGSLQEWFATHTSEIKPFLSLQDINDIIQMAAKALQYAHKRGVIHSDVKPSNFLVENKNERLHILLSDFGTAKITNAGSTVKGEGTALYMPPEQWDGDPTEKSDQYALAITAYQLLTGHCPFEGNHIQLQYQHKNVTPDPPSQFNHSLNSATDKVILRALAKNPGDRYPSIIDFAAAFQEAIFRNAKPIDISLIITSSEAKKGTNKFVQLRDGTSFAVSVPRNAKNGQTIHVDRIDKSHHHGAKEKIIITLTVIPDETRAYPSNIRLRSLPAIDIPFRPQKKFLFGFIALALILIVMTTIVTNTNPLVKWVYYNYVTLPNATTVARARATATHNAKQALITRATATANANASATPGVLRTATLGTPIYADSLTDTKNPTTQAEGWDGLDGSSDNCKFSKDGYHILAKLTEPQPCQEVNNKTYQNFTMSADMNINSNDSSGGLLFYVQNNSSNILSGFFFEISTTPDRYDLATYKISILNCQCSTALYGWVESSAIHQGHYTNTLQVIVNQNDFKFYVNGTFLHELPISDTLYQQYQLQQDGEIGFACFDKAHKGDAVFSNLKIYS